MIGIYKITSPENVSYIGQSFDIHKRMGRHKDLKNSKLTDLVNSFVSFGFGNHSFDILYELPEGVSQSVLDEYESFYINQFREGGLKLFNIKEGGSRGKHATYTLAKLSKAATGREGFWRGKKRSKESIAKAIATRLGKYSAWNKGMEWSAEAKHKMSIARLGKPPANKGVGKKLDKGKVLEIRELLAASVTHKIISLKFGISQSVVSNISTGKLWADA